MSDREKILSGIRHSLRRKQGLDETIKNSLRARLAAHQNHIQPFYDEVLLDRFVAKHKALQGTVSQISHQKELATELKKYIQTQQLSNHVVMGESILFDGLQADSDLRIDRRRALNEDKLCVSKAYGAVAETGTLVLKSSADSPLTHNYMPDHHIVLLEAKDVVRWQEDIWDKLRLEGDFPPRGICFISGPSKTADIEQTIEYGAHGPRCLHLVMLYPETEEN